MPTTLDVDPRSIFSSRINGLIDESLQIKAAQEPKRDYLGASQLGASCARAIQYGYTRTPPDNPAPGRTLRIFEMGHALEAMALKWLRGAGFDIYTRQSDGSPFGFFVAGGRIRGHVDGVIYSGRCDAPMTYPALWECKSMNAKSWKQTATQGLKAAKPAYAVQIALYQAYMEEAFPGISKSPALLTAVNKDTAELYHELIPFDAALAQEASDRAVNILRATEAKETLPRISMDSDYFTCRFCDWNNHCWTTAVGIIEIGTTAVGTTAVGTTAVGTIEIERRNNDAP